MDVVPTTSTTAAMVLGDALAVAALQSRNFSKEDFARLHPSGVLGKRLSLTVGELMHKGDAMPLIGMDTPLREALFEITNKRLGCTGITDREGRLAGIITDGDLRRILIKNPARARDEGLESHDRPAAHDARGRLSRSTHSRRWRWIRAAPVTQLFVIDESRSSGRRHPHPRHHPRGAEVAPAAGAPRSRFIWNCDQ